MTSHDPTGHDPTGHDPTGLPDGRELLDGMGWETLPYGCIGITRSSDAGRDRTVWSWLILIPWAENDAKPWIDGTELKSASVQTNEQERADVIQHMREVLDKRYGKTVGERAADDFLKRLREHE